MSGAVSQRAGSLSRDGRFELAIVLSFAPFAWKAWVYARLDSYLPLAVFLLLAAVVSSGFTAGGRAARWSVRIWAAAMVLWGAARLALLVMVFAAGLDEAHLRSQLDPRFVGASLVYLAAGFLIWRRA